ncbi:hypothetical protein [Streptomyces sp. NPDC058330]|uniref:hypothetical protein n=1 Tax=Streptomyces sp. NPDC058330 TaxID=3346449 RepID=UPI0036E9C47A
MSDFDGSNRLGSKASEAVPPAVRDKAGEGAGLVSDKAGEVAGTAKDQVSDVAGEATARARDVAGELREQLREQARTQTERLAENVRRLSDELRDMSDSDRNGSSAARAVRQVADGGHQVASRIEHRGPEGLVGDLQDFARRRPGAFLAGAALLGFATARIGKGVKSADGGATGGRPAPASGGQDRPRSAAGDDGYPSPSPGATPPYGGSAPAPGPVPRVDPYTDPRQP